MRSVAIVSLALVLAGCVVADLYVHGCNPGSNNKLNENSNTRDENNRLMNTQNGNNGGYNAITTNDPGTGKPPTLYFYPDTVLPVRWTSQHGQKSGTDGVSKSTIIFQYICDHYNPANSKSVYDLSGVRNGEETTKIPNDADANNVATYGRHEPYAWYAACETRDRNAGLWTSTQNVRDDRGATATMQNANGNDENNRSGYECPEERDYYPYWHPTPFIDAAVLTYDTGKCGFYTSESGNKKDKGICTGDAAADEFNNEADCTGAGKTWSVTGSWDRSAPDCAQIPTSYENHHGFAGQVLGQQAQYDWKVPNDVGENCAFRARYNISSIEVTDDLDSSDNDGASPVQTDPKVEWSKAAGYFVNGPLRLAINTNQDFRAFQDRTHVYAVRQRPENLDNKDIIALTTIGKRGALQNIYPTMENDFCPKVLSVKTGQMLHIQLYAPETGAANNRNNAAGGPGQNANRHNMVEVVTMGAIYPAALEEGNLFDTIGTAVNAAYPNQVADTCNANAGEQDGDNCGKINTGPHGYADLGVMAINKTGTFYYYSSRNMIYSNRDEKGSLAVSYGLSTLAQVFIAIAAVVGVAALVMAGIYVQARRDRHGRCAQIVKYFSRGGVKA
jgi:hypothetical protein